MNGAGAHTFNASPYHPLGQHNNDFLESYRLPPPALQQPAKRAPSRCNRGLVSYLFMFSNIVLAASGAGLIILGSWSFSDVKPYKPIVNDKTYSFLSSFFIMLGVSMVVLAAIGFYAAIVERKSFLKAYAIITGIIMVVELTIACVVLVHKQVRVDSFVETSLNQTMSQKYSTSSDGVRKAVDQLQAKSMCCGVQFYTDWTYSKWVREVNAVDESNTSPKEFVYAPESCCKTQLPNCGSLQHPNNLFEHGCFHKMSDYFHQNLLIFALSILALAFLQIFSLLFAVVLYNRVRRKLVWEWF